MRSREIALLMILVVGTALSFLWVNLQQRAWQGQRQATSTAVDPAAVALTSKTAAPEQASDTLKSSAAAPVESAGESTAEIQAIQLPEVSQIREEVAANPHSLAPSLAKWSMEMGQHLQNALRTEESAHSFLSSLKDCIGQEDGKVYPPAEVVCLSHAKTVGQKYPLLMDEARALMETSKSEEAKKIISSMGLPSLIK